MEIDSFVWPDSNSDSESESESDNDNDNDFDSNSKLPPIYIQNEVYTCNLTQKLNLRHVCEVLDYLGLEYNPKKLAAVIWRTRSSSRCGVFGFIEDKPQNERGWWVQFFRENASLSTYVHHKYAPYKQKETDFYLRTRKTLLIYSTGKIVCVGVKTSEQALYMIKTWIGHLQKNNFAIELEKESFRIQNIVSSVVTPFNINISAFASKKSENCTYEAEMFPGVIVDDICSNNESLKAIVFKSGKMVVTGAKKKKQIKRVVRTMMSWLKGFTTPKHSKFDDVASGQISNNYSQINQDVLKTSHKNAQRIVQQILERKIQKRKREEEEKEKEKEKESRKGKKIRINPDLETDKIGQDMPNLG